MSCFGEKYRAACKKEATLPAFVQMEGGWQTMSCGQNSKNKPLHMAPSVSESWSFGRRRSCFVFVWRDGVNVCLQLGAAPNCRHLSKRETFGQRLSFWYAICSDKHETQTTTTKRSTLGYWRGHAKKTKGEKVAWGRRRDERRTKTRQKKREKGCVREWNDRTDEKWEKKRLDRGRKKIKEEQNVRDKCVGWENHIGLGTFFIPLTPTSSDMVRHHG